MSTLGGHMSRNYHHGALAEAMVNQALADVREFGADRVSLRSITTALDVSPSAAYNHFARKDDLLQAVGTCGLAVLDERMAQVLAAHPGASDQAAKDRFAGLARAYVSFATEETHLFQLTFSPMCVHHYEAPEATGPYQKLTAALDDLDQRGLLKPGIRPGLDLTIWAATHGMATLIVEGAMPPESVELLIQSVHQLVLKP